VGCPSLADPDMWKTVRFRKTRKNGKRPHGVVEGRGKNAWVLNSGKLPVVKVMMEEYRIEIVVHEGKKPLKSRERAWCLNVS